MVSNTFVVSFVLHIHLVCVFDVMNVLHAFGNLFRWSSASCPQPGHGGTCARRVHRVGQRLARLAASRLIKESPERRVQTNDLSVSFAPWGFKRKQNGHIVEVQLGMDNFMSMRSLKHFTHQSLDNVTLSNGLPSGSPGAFRRSARRWSWCITSVEGE